jgi:hypothetical protein
VTNAFIQMHPLDNAQDRGLVDDFLACVEPTLSQEQRIQLKQVKTRDNVFAFQSDTFKSDPALGSQTQSCVDLAVYGPTREFTSSGS